MGICVTISIHTFLAEGDWAVIPQIKVLSNFNPHLPCGRWPPDFYAYLSIHNISIHTFLAEGDRGRNMFALHLPLFQSTPSLRKVTVFTFTILVFVHLFQSTPSLRKVTVVFWFCPLPHLYFNPHLPCGRWHRRRICNSFQHLFQSTPSLRKVT